MKLRRRELPAGWYPEGALETRTILDEWRSKTDSPKQRAVSVVAPHAGWFFSGELAFNAIRCIQESVETIVVAGGHLGRRDHINVQIEDAAETPLGEIRTDKVVLDAITSEFDCRTDSGPDNTVEVHLAMIRFLYPNAMYVGIRVPPNDFAFSIGSALYRISSDANRRIAIIGSTDLTHYGIAYGFTPLGPGEDAVRWVTEENDRLFLDELTAMRLPEALDLAKQRHSACSAGAAVTAAAFAAKSGISSGRVVGYTTSADQSGDRSFVGYGALAYEER